MTLVFHAVFAALSLATTWLALTQGAMGVLGVTVSLMLSFAFLGGVAEEVSGYFRQRRGKPRAWEDE